jgi:type-F conjugative transfer system pilin assembly protein TrbC
MEEKKLLRILIKLMVLSLLHVCYASNSNNEIYNEIHKIKDNTDMLVERYKSSANKLKEGTAEVVKQANIDKEYFLKQQKRLVENAYNTQGKPKNNSSVLVFVSFSMPEKSIREIIIESEKYGGNVIIQGIINNSFKDTVDKIAKIANETGNKGGVSIDPNLFMQYKIHQVPAYVIRTDEANYDIVYGLGSVKEALDVVASGNTKLKAEAKKMLQSV